MSSSDYDCIYDFEHRATVIIDNFLPPKSRKIFMDWRNKKNTSISESVFFWTYIQEISKKFQPSILWSMYSTLITTTKMNHEVIVYY